MELQTGGSNVGLLMTHLATLCHFSEKERRRLASNSSCRPYGYEVFGVSTKGITLMIGSHIT